MVCGCGRAVGRKRKVRLLRMLAAAKRLDLDRLDLDRLVGADKAEALPVHRLDVSRICLNASPSRGGRTPSPLWGEGWGEGGVRFNLVPLTRPLRHAERSTSPRWGEVKQ